MDLPQPKRFRLALHRAKGCYFAFVMDLPGCYSRGATEVEAVENARAAIRSWLWVRQAIADDRASLVFEIGA
jgi:predicted RNase H-like HicB family nuclease